METHTRHKHHNTYIAEYINTLNNNLQIASVKEIGTAHVGSAKLAIFCQIDEIA